MVDVPGRGGRRLSSGPEAAADGQVPLWFAIGEKHARGGLYGILRGFNGLELKRTDQESLLLRRQFEAGFSFSTAPNLRVWKLTVPWLAAGYQFGPALSGIRFYASFPF